MPRHAVSNHMVMLNSMDFKIFHKVGAWEHMIKGDAPGSSSSISRNGLDSELGCQKEVGGSYFMSCDAPSGSSCSTSRNALDSELGCHE